MCEVQLLIHSETSKVEQFKFGNGSVISSQIYCACDYLSIQGLNLIHVNKMAPYN